MKKVITYKNWCRPDYYLTSLNSLMYCDGIEGYTIYNSIDKHNKAQEIAEIDRTHPIRNKCELITNISSKQLGCAENTRVCLEMGFDKLDADFVIHMEDDNIASKDFILFMEEMAEKFHDDPEIFVICGYNFRKDKLDHEEFLRQLPYFSIRTPFKTYLGWGTWKHIWDELRNNWFGIHWKNAEPTNIPDGEEFLNHIKEANDGSWGWPMLKYHRRGRKEVFPVVSRIQNIGEDRGRFNQNREWHRKNVFTEPFADRHGYNGEFLFYPNYPT